MADGVAVTPFAAGSVHGFFRAAFGDELLLGCFQKFVYEVVCLLDKHETEVGKFDVLVFCNTLVDERVEVCCFAVLKTEVVCPYEILAVFGPGRLAANSQVVGVVFVEFCKATFGYVDKLNHHFLGGDSVHDAFGDVLFAGTRCLYHLVDGAIAFLVEGVGKGVGDIIEGLCLFVEELAMIVARSVEEMGA